MLYSRLSKYISPERESRLIDILTWGIRVLLGAVFMFSGFVKAIDPWGTLYKMEDYLSAMGISLWPGLVITAVFTLCAIEFLTGVFFVFGCFRRSTAIAALVIMAFMTPLTLWIAIADPVADCGCFGDALVIGNWPTFFKNILLTLASVWMVMFSHRIGCPITPALQWLAFIASALFILIIECCGYMYQPLLDFRPYKTGTSLLPETETNSETEPEIIFIYEKDGKKQEFSIDNLPEESDGWVYVDRKEKGETRETKGAIKGFRLWDGDTDVTDEAISGEGGLVLLLMPDLKDVSIATIWKINSLYEWGQRHGIDMIAAVAGNASDIANWQDLALPEYPIYTSDDTSIKEIARGNPAVIYADNGIIRWKSTLGAINVEDFLSPETSDDPMSFARDNKRILLNFIYVYLTVMAVLVAFSFLPKLTNHRTLSKENGASKI